MSQTYRQNDPLLSPSVQAGDNGNMSARINNYTTQNQVPAGQDGSLDFILTKRDSKAFKRANRHSWIVRLFKILFPLLAVLMIVGLFLAYYWAKAGAPVLAVQEINYSDGRTVMKNPELNGVDKEQRPYELKAAEAIQDIKKPSQIELNQIDANVPMQDGVFANILAGYGLYDSEAKTLKLDGEVDVTTKTGMSFKLQDADIDMDAGTLKTTNPIVLISPQAKINAVGLQVEDNGERIILNQKVRMTIYPDKLQAAAANGSQQQ